MKNRTDLELEITRLRQIIEDLLDGIQGEFCESGYNRYWKIDALRAAEEVTGLEVLSLCDD